MTPEEAAELVRAAVAGLVEAAELEGPGSFSLLRDSIDRGVARLDAYALAIASQEAETPREIREQLALFASGMVQIAAAAQALLVVVPVARADLGPFHVQKTRRDRSD